MNRKGQRRQKHFTSQPRYEAEAPKESDRKTGRSEEVSAVTNGAKARNENALFPLWRYSFSFMAFATEAKSVSFVLVAAFVSWTHFTLLWKTNY